MNPEQTRTLTNHDVTDLIGLSVVIDGAIEIIDADGEVMHEIPDIEGLSAAAAVARCLLPVRLQPAELRVLRHIADWTAVELALMLGENTAAESISRWESGKQPMGGYVEKLFRVLICEHLHSRAQGVDYAAGTVARLVIIDPWRADPAFKVPAIHFDHVSIKIDNKRMQVWEPEPQQMAA